ncbi:uncharacterized protein LOC114255732 isoform X2 [Monomorium pharaonis]|nr:uncharacterized protein LOC114255732 isoform X2 [Monomorium pharaonis]XP_036139216.1 uncharacterized protein LOC114255732 isoform X2 [Monomorium pharaonis]XP_036139217.1 uncharacterized protein LOC114255732 isoform X2 [Monomorium pharaonis]
MRTQNYDDIRKKMKNNVCSFPMKSFKILTMEDTNIFKGKAIANKKFHNVQLIRNLPNILRSNNTKVSRNHKSCSDTSFTSSIEDGNTSLELNTTLSSIDLDMEINYNKTTSPKPHHQRKQVHNPLNMQYDISDCNNNKNKNVDQLNILPVSESCEENTPTKKLKCRNKQKKRLLDKKLKKIAPRRSSNRTQISHKKSDMLTIVPDIDMKSTIVVQNSSNFLENNILTQSVNNPNFPTINVNDLNDIATKLLEPSNIFYNNNEICNIKQCDTNLDHVIPCKKTEFNTMQYETVQRDPTSYELPIIENNVQQESIDRYIGSNVLCEPKMLYSCSCANCMSHDKDIIFYEDPNSTSTSSDDMETELCTYDLYTNIYDFYINNYFHVFGDSVIDFEKANLCCEEFGVNSITKENTCTDCNNTTELIKSNANMLSIDQNKSQNLQSYHIDRIQDVCVESYPSEFVAYPNETGKIENVRVFNETDISNFLNLENFSTKENKRISQNETLIQNVSSSDVPVFNSKCQTSENNKDFCVLQCSQCGKLFRKKHQLWKHFSNCDFYKENFQCHICNKIYRHKSSLAQHLRLVHKASTHGRHEKFYTCNKCSKSYVRFRAFQRHMLLHDD